MFSLPIGIILLSITTILIFLGFFRATLDRMRLTDRTTIIMLVLLIISHFMPVIRLNQYLAFNIGTLIPLGVIFYLLLTTSNMEKQRAILILIGNSILLYFAERIFLVDSTQFIFNLDPLYLPGISAGLLAYLTTRSRRSAFIAGSGSIIVLDLIAAFTNLSNRLHSQIIIGGAGIFDALIINGVIAVFVAEIIGEIRERLHRGAAELDNQGGDQYE